MISFIIDKNNPNPAYRQIEDQIRLALKTGGLKGGDRLPPERDLAQTLGIARGTITRAYEALSRDGLLDMTRGRGTFIAETNPTTNHLPAEPLLDRKESAQKYMDAMLDQLEALRFSEREIRMLFDLRMLEREKEELDFYVAAVDCNPEALAIYEKQLAVLPGVQLAKILLDDLEGASDALKKLAPFDLLLTTTTHAQELTIRFPSLRDRILPLAVAPSRDTVTRLARLSPALQIGILCESWRFFTIISNQLKEHGIHHNHIHSLFHAELVKLPDFLEKVDAIITPPAFSLMQDRNHLTALQSFTDKGGLLIPFEYQIDRGSLLHTETRIHELMEQRR